MAVQKAGTKPADLHALESSLTALGRKLTGAVPLRPGNILIRLTDSGEQLRVEGSGREVRVTRAAAGSKSVVEISGSSAVFKAIIDGKKEVRRAFIGGGIQVRGDLNYLEALLKDVGLLECGE
jgi:hypothetical protein